MSEDPKPRKVLSLKKKVTEEPSQPTTSPSRSILGLNRPRTLDVQIRKLAYTKVP